MYETVVYLIVCIISFAIGSYMQGPFQAIYTSELRFALILAYSLTYDTNISHTEHSFLHSISTHINLILTHDTNKSYTHCRLQSYTNGSHASGIEF